MSWLERYGFDQKLFASWQKAVKSGAFSKENNVVTGDLTPPEPGSVQKLPGAATKAGKDVARLGADAIGRGELGVVILNGGMATRFGGVVKGTVPVLGKDRSFLALAFEDVLQAQREHGGTIQVFLMNSFATEESTRQHLESHGWFGLDPKQVHSFNQFVSVRMTRDGKLFTTADGTISAYGPGHGDFAGAFRASGCLQRFLGAGGKWLLVRNVDNLGARISPLLLGQHIKAATDMTIELAPKWPEDVGGSPFCVDGKLQLVEQIRYPKDFDPNVVQVFNTNTFWFRAAALDREFDLGRYYVEKTVEDRKVVQIEHLIGEMSAHLSCTYLQVRRSGKDNRFLPIKTPEDLTAAREEILEIYGQGAEGSAD